MPPHNSKHMLITFATNLDTMFNKVKANYASSSSSRSINCAIRGTPRSYYLCWSQITTVHLWTKLFSSKHDVWILVGNTGSRRSSSFVISWRRWSSGASFQTSGSSSPARLSLSLISLQLDEVTSELSVSKPSELSLVVLKMNKMIHVSVYHTET